MKNDNLKNIIVSSCKDGTQIVGVIETSKRSCVVFGVGSYKGNQQGFIRKYIVGDKYNGFSRSGLNASLDVWEKVSTVISDIKKIDLTVEKCEICKIPLDHSMAAQIYFQKPRIVIGKIYNYQSYDGYCGGAGVDIKYISEYQKYVEGIIKLLSINEDVEENKVPDLRIIDHQTNVNDDYTQLL